VTVRPWALAVVFPGVLALLTTVACDRDATPRPATADRSSAAAKATGTTGGTPRTDSLHISSGARLVAIGDVHGDVEATRAALRLAGVLDGDDRWSGAADTLVQTGDQLDRGDDEGEIVDLLDRLSKEADKAGGKVVVLNGNHETMNVRLDFRYVTPGGFEDFQGEVAPPTLAPSARAALDRMPAATRGRAAAFMPGGRMARKLAEHDVVAFVGDSVFVHGGVLPKHVRYGLDKLNREVSAWMRGEAASPAIMQGEDAPVWSRDYSGERPADCATLDETLQLIGAKRMVVGHTVQRSGITSDCDEKVWRIDVGMAKHYGGSPQVLEIRGDAVRVLKP